MTGSELSSILSKSRFWLTFIFIVQSTLILICSIGLALYNLGIISWLSAYDVIINSALFGEFGTLVYFSRKTYVYLITNKFFSVSCAVADGNIECIKGAFRGYYLYLMFRPIVGIIIGPLMYMLVIAGLISFMKMHVTIDQMSLSGKAFIYIISFLGGHTSSDLFDRFSKLAKEVMIRKE